MHVRLATSDDYKKIGFRRAIEQFQGQITNGGLEYCIEKRMRNPHLFTFVAMDGWNCIGTASLLLDYKIHKDGNPAGLIEDVAVDPTQQKKGAGSLLMEHLVSFAKEKGCYKLVLCCSKENMRFYEKLGFCQHEFAMRLSF
jgi:ribosomal protein S18 acetylase RimI-like enzyme